MDKRKNIGLIRIVRVNIDLYIRKCSLLIQKLFFGIGTKKDENVITFENIEQI